MTARQVETLCAAAIEGAGLTLGDVEHLLGLDDFEDAEVLFSAAREQRRRYFGDAVFLYGFVYYSTFCRNGCAFCFYRAANTLSPRYRKDAGEVVEICKALAESGVNLLDLTLGEDPLLFDAGDFSPLIDLVGRVRCATNLPIMVSPGVLPRGVLAELRCAGVDFYAVYQETHDRELFGRLRLRQDFDERIRARQEAHELGLLVEDGMLCGVGNTAESRAASLLAMRAAGDQQVRAMTLVPQPETPLERAPLRSSWHELLAIAVMRVLMPERLIPASLDVEGIEGLQSRLDAGANVVTSLVPPRTGLCGVASPEFEVDDGLRTAEEVRGRLADVGLRQGTQSEFRYWLDSARQHRELRSLAAVGVGWTHDPADSTRRALPDRPSLGVRGRPARGRRSRPTRAGASCVLPRGCGVASYGGADGRRSRLGRPGRNPLLLEVRAGYP